MAAATHSELVQVSLTGAHTVEGVGEDPFSCYGQIPQLQQTSMCAMCACSAYAIDVTNNFTAAAQHLEEGGVSLSAPGENSTEHCRKPLDVVTPVYMTCRF